MPEPIQSAKALALGLFGPTYLGGLWSVLLVIGTGHGGAYGAAVFALAASAVVTMIGGLVWGEVADGGDGSPVEWPRTASDFLKLVAALPLVLLGLKVLAIAALVVTASAAITATLVGWLITHDLLLGLLAGAGTVAHAPIGQAWTARKLDVG